jgi:S1-C subfamily serine protease
VKFLFSRLFSFLFAAFTVLACASTSPRDSLPNDSALVRELENQTVAVYMLRGDSPICTGVWVGDRRILTAAHCASEDLLDPVFFSTYSEHNGLFQTPLAVHSMALVKLDKVHDLALFETGVFDTPKHVTATIAITVPKVGETLHFEGHTRGLAWSYKHGWVSSYREADAMADGEVLGPWMQVSAPIAGGDSGGGAYNVHGELVGVASRSPRGVPNSCFYIYLPTIRKFLEKT